MEWLMNHLFHPLHRPAAPSHIDHISSAIHELLEVLVVGCSIGWWRVDVVVEVVEV
jgi:hypothetical protein